MLYLREWYFNFGSRLSVRQPAVRFILLLLGNKDIKARSWSPKQGVLIWVSIGAAVTGGTYYPDSISHMNTGGLGKITTFLFDPSTFFETHFIILPFKCLHKQGEVTLSSETSRL